MASLKHKTSLIWTRSCNDWAQDRKYLQTVTAGEHPVIHLPCIRKKAIEWSQNQPIEDWLSPKSVFVFSSSYAVELACKDPRLLPALKNLGAICMSLAGRKILLEKGIKEPRLGIKDGQQGQPKIETINYGKDLAEYLCARLDRQASEAVLLGGTQRAYDLASHLHRKKFKAINLDLYQTQLGAHHRSGRRLSEGEIQEIRQLPSALVCFASPSAIRGFIQGIWQKSPEQGNCTNQPWNSSQFHAHVIGLTTQKAALDYFEHVSVSPSTHISSLVASATKRL